MDDLKKEATLLLSPTGRRKFMSIAPNLTKEAYYVVDVESKKEMDDLKEDA